MGRSPRGPARSTCGRSTTRSPASERSRSGRARLAARRKLPDPRGPAFRTALEQTAYLRTVQDWIIRPQIKTVPAWPASTGSAASRSSYHVQPDPDKLASLDLSFTDVARALEANNANQGARYLEDNGEGYVVRAAGRARGHGTTSATSWSRPAGRPCRADRDIAEVRIGATCAPARERGRPGGRHRHRPDADRREQPHGGRRGRRQDGPDPQEPAPRRRGPDRLDRTRLVEADGEDGGRRTCPRARPSSSSSCSCCSATSAAVITALVIPVAMLMTLTGMVEAKISANLMSLAPLDYRPHRRRGGDHHRERLRHLAEKQHALGGPRDRGAPSDGAGVGRGDDQSRPSYGQAIIILVYVPLLTFTGVEGKMFAADGADRHHRTRWSRLHPVADLRAGADRHRHHPARSPRKDTSSSGR